MQFLLLRLVQRLAISEPERSVVLGDPKRDDS
jgi:hypothetical protein